MLILHWLACHMYVLVRVYHSDNLTVCTYLRGMQRAELQKRLEARCNRARIQPPRYLRMHVHTYYTYTSSNNIRDSPWNAVGAIQNVSSNYKRRCSDFSPFWCRWKALGIWSRHVFVCVYLILSRLKARQVYSTIECDSDPIQLESVQNQWWVAIAESRPQRELNSFELWLLLSTHTRH